MQLRHYSDQEQAKSLLWWEGTHCFVIMTVMAIMAGWMTINAMVMMNFELDHPPIPHMWKGVAIGLVICIFEAIKARMCQYRLQDLRIFPQPPENQEE